jgi:hypothetical protein
MKQNNKKGTAFELINAGMISFIGFMLIVLLAVLLVSTVKTTSMVCPTRTVNGVCLSCASTSSYILNNSDCCVTDATCTGGNLSVVTVYSGGAYNATLKLGQAAQLPAQFAQIIVIVVIITGILAMLGAIGYTVYNKMKK